MPAAADEHQLTLSEWLSSHNNGWRSIKKWIIIGLILVRLTLYPAQIQADLSVDPRHRRRRHRRYPSHSEETGPAHRYASHQGLIWVGCGCAGEQGRGAFCRGFAIDIF